MGGSSARIPHRIWSASDGGREVRARRATDGSYETRGEGKQGIPPSFAISASLCQLTMVCACYCLQSSSGVGKGVVVVKREEGRESVEGGASRRRRGQGDKYDEEREGKQARMKAWPDSRQTTYCVRKSTRLNSIQFTSRGSFHAVPVPALSGSESSSFALVPIAPPTLLRFPSARRRRRPGCVQRSRASSRLRLTMMTSGDRVAGDERPGERARRRQSRGDLRHE